MRKRGLLPAQISVTGNRARVVIHTRSVVSSRYLFCLAPRKLSVAPARVCRSLHAWPRAKGNPMSTDQEQQADPKRYVYYSLAALAVTILAAFLFLFNFTSFFRLAVPL